MEIITSVTNNRIKRLVKLREKAGERRRESVFLAEGVRLVSEVPLDRQESLFVTEDWVEAWKNEAQDSLSGTDQDQRRRREVFRRMDTAEAAGNLIQVSDEVFAKIADTRTPQGVLALVKNRTDRIEEIAARFSRLLFLENLQDPGNIGTMLRVSEAAGAAMILTKGCADITQPKVVRASMGAVFRVPVVVLGHNHDIESGVEPEAGKPAGAFAESGRENGKAAADDPSSILQFLRTKGFQIVAAHLDGTDMYETNLGGKSVFLIGNEGNGLSDELTAMADCRILIPMEGEVESLNAAMSAGLLLYEARRQQIYAQDCLKTPLSGEGVDGGASNQK